MVFQWFIALDSTYVCTAVVVLSANRPVTPSSRCKTPAPSSPRSTLYERCQSDQRQTLEDQLGSSENTRSSRGGEAPAPSAADIRSTANGGRRRVLFSSKAAVNTLGGN